MAESIDTGVAQSTRHVATSKERTSTTANNMRPKSEDSSSRDSVEMPKIRIAEVASQAATGKKESLESLTDIANELRDAINALNSALEKSPTKAIITRDEELNRFIVRIADQRSGEVVREVPSEAVLKFARNLQELKGLIFDKTL